MCTCVYCVIFFFFKQKTAYEMRISDWSSDVCSSDLGPDDGRDSHRLGFRRQFADFLDLLENLVGARIDGEADCRAAESQRVIDACGHGLVDGGRPAVRRIHLENGRNLAGKGVGARLGSEEHTSELQSLMRISYA